MFLISNWKDCQVSFKIEQKLFNFLFFFFICLTQFSSSYGTLHTYFNHFLNTVQPAVTPCNLKRTCSPFVCNFNSSGIPICYIACYSECGESRKKKQWSSREMFWIPLAPSPPHEITRNPGSTLYLGPLRRPFGDYKWLVSVSKTVKYAHKRVWALVPANVRAGVCIGNARVCGVIDVGYIPFWSLQNPCVHSGSGYERDAGRSEWRRDANVWRRRRRRRRWEVDWEKSSLTR